jgi:hypothetical protein
MTPHELNHRLQQWAAAYGGEQYARLGYASAARLDAAEADAPPAAAAQIEIAVQTMEQTGRWKEARVLRAEYFLAAQPEALRLTRLKRLGLSMSRTSYYVYLDAARAFIAGALSGSE